MEEPSPRLAMSLVIIPTYNEADNVSPLARAILQVANVHILFVDDNSPDRTGDVILSLVKEFPGKVHYLARADKLGLGKAYIEGMTWGLKQGYKQLIEMDADFSHHPSYLPNMLQVLEEADVAVGSRYVSGGGTVNWGLMRRLISRFGSLYARLILRVPLWDLTGGFNGWRHEVLEAIDLGSIKSEGYAFQIELKYKAHRLGVPIKEFPIMFQERRVGQSKMSTKIFIEAIFRVWYLRFMMLTTSKKIGGSRAL